MRILAKTDVGRAREINQDSYYVCNIKDCINKIIMLVYVTQVNEKKN